jgi:hypothetical protein
MQPIRIPKTTARVAPIHFFLVLLLFAFTCNGETINYDDVFRKTGFLQADWIGVVDIVSVDDVPVKAPVNVLPSDEPGVYTVRLSPVSSEGMLKFNVVRVLYKQSDVIDTAVVDRITYRNIHNGNRCLLFLSSGHVVSSGIIPHTPELEKRVVEVIKGISPWSPPRAGVTVAIVPDRLQLSENDDLNLYFRVRNVSMETISLPYPSISSHTHWESSFSSRAR